MADIKDRRHLAVAEDVAEPTVPPKLAGAEDGSDGGGWQKWHRATSVKARMATVILSDNYDDF